MHKNKLKFIKNNSQYLGFKHQSHINKYIKDVKVFLMPYSYSDLQSFRSPLKLAEYLSTGRPIVSIPYDFIKNDFKDLVYTADDDESFIKQIALALCETNPGLESKRLALSEEFSWDKVYTKLFKVL